MKPVTSILLLFLLAAGCGIFDTREAEKPEESGIRLQQAIEPKQLIANLVISMESKLPDYITLFADTLFGEREFTFIPSSRAIPLYPSLSEEWGIDKEEDYFRNFRNNTLTDVPVNLILENFNLTLGDTAIYTADYSIHIEFSNQTIPSDYEGELIFYMYTDNNNIWRIYYWQDFGREGDILSWSDLKGRLGI